MPCPVLRNNDWPAAGEVQLVPTELELIAFVANARFDVMTADSTLVSLCVSRRSITY